MRGGGWSRLMGWCKRSGSKYLRGGVSGQKDLKIHVVSIMNKALNTIGYA